jgi:PAS domain S-box-containing protein
MVSAAAADLLGTTARDLEGLRLQELLEAPGPGVVEAVYRSLAEPAAGAAGGAPERLAARVRLPDGSLVEVDLRLSRLPGASGIPGATLIDIDLLHLAGRGSTPETGASMARSNADPVIPPEIKAAATEDAFVICRTGTIVHAGDGFERLAGMSAGSLTGWSVKSLVAAEDLMPVVEILRHVESGEEEGADFGFHLLRAGKMPPLEVAARARRISHRGAPAVLIGLRDISESLRAARLAADRLRHLDAALDATGDAVLILGAPEAGLPVLLTSRNLDTMFGVTGSSWIGHPFAELWRALRPAHAAPEQEEESLFAALERAAEAGARTVPMAAPPGRVLERYVGPMRSASGETLGRICIFRDVTARVQAESQMRTSADQARRAREELEMLHEEVRLANEGLEKRLAEMQRLNKDLKVLDEMKSNLLANVSHELQTPLVSIKGFTEMILKGRLGDVTPEQERGLQVALRNINRLIGLIDNLLAFARTEGPSTALKLESFSLGALVDEAVEMVGERASERGIHVKVLMPPEGLAIRADRDKILQVILNLLTNAVKYNRDGGEVVVEASSGPKGAARVEVRDTGIGIPRDELDRIFDRYYQAGNVTGPREGTGIGLAITKDILRQHGCMIRADSEEAKGSVFSFTLPIDRKSRPDHRSSPRLSAGGPSSAGLPKEGGAPRIPATEKSRVVGGPEES